MFQPRFSPVFGIVVLSLPFLCAAYDRRAGGEAIAQGEKELRAGGPATIERREPEATSLDASGHSLLFARGLQDGTILVREGKAGEPQRTLAGDGRALTSLSFSPDGIYLTSGYQDGTVRLWDPRSGREWWVRRDHSTPVDGLIFSPEGSWLVSVGRDARLLVYDIPGALDVHDLTERESHWIWAIMPVKAREPQPTILAKAPGLELGRSSSMRMAAGQTGAVIFRPARLRVETEYVERSALQRETGAQASAELSLLDRSAEALVDTHPDRELAVAVTLSLDQSVDFGSAPVDRVSFRLSPCAAVSRCRSPELTLGVTQEILAKSEGTPGPGTAARGWQSLLPKKFIDPVDSLSADLEASRRSYGFHLPLTALSDVFERRQARSLNALLDSSVVTQSFFAFSRDGSTVSWVFPSGMVHIYDLHRDQHVQLLVLPQDMRQGELRASLLRFWRAKNFSNFWSRWEIRDADWSFLLVKVFLENRLQEKSTLPLSGVYLRSDTTFYPAAGVLDRGLSTPASMATVALPEKGEAAQVFVFVVPHSVAVGLQLHILDLTPIDLAR